MMFRLTERRPTKFASGLILLAFLLFATHCSTASAFFQDNSQDKSQSKLDTAKEAKAETESAKNADGSKETGDSSEKEASKRLGIPELRQAMNQSDDENELETTIGFPKLIYQKVIEGPKIIAKPLMDKKQAVVVRIVDTYTHGDHFRYDIEYKGLEPGEYNIADFLKRENGSNEPIEAINVKVESLLGPGQVIPYELPPQKSRYSYYYLPALLVGGAVWVAGLLMILFYGRGKKKRPSGTEKQVTVADRMKPLLDAAAAGEMNSQQQAELERVLSSFWSKKLRLGHLSADQLRQHLRQHSDASVLLDQIDSWIHKPNGDNSDKVDVNQILEPYKAMDYDEVMAGK